MMSTLFKYYSENKNGTDWAVGDIHGCFTRLEKALIGVGFDKEKDRLFSVGDLVDRGYESQLAEEYIKKTWFHAVRGNHDDMAIRWPNGFMDKPNYEANGGGWNIDRSHAEQLKTADAFNALLIAIEVEAGGIRVGIVHAECPYDDWGTFKKALTGEMGKGELKHAYDMAMWSRRKIQDRNNTKITGIDLVVVGHTPVQNQTLLGNTYYIDIGAVFGHPFFIFNLKTREGFRCDA